VGISLHFIFVLDAGAAFFGNPLESLILSLSQLVHLRTQPFRSQRKVFIASINITGLRCLIEVICEPRTNVRFWLRTVLTAPDKQSPLYPQQQTSKPARPLSH
jgi:hypothetical protein